MDEREARKAGPNGRLLEVERQALHSARLESFRAFDQAILGLSSGALIVSLALISEQQAPLTNARFPCVLRGSWLMFTVAVLSTLFSFVTSRCAIDHRLKELDEASTSAAATQGSDAYGTGTTCLNLLAGGRFILGLIFTVAFVWANI